MSIRRPSGMVRAPLLAVALVVTAALGACGSDGAQHTTSNPVSTGSPNAIVAASVHQGLSLVSAQLGTACVQPNGATNAAAGANVIVALCQGTAAERWYFDPSGHLSLSSGLGLGLGADNTSLQLVAVDSNRLLRWQLQGGHVVAGALTGNNGNMLTVGVSADAQGHYPLSLAVGDVTSTAAASTFSVGQASLGAGNTLVLDGFSIRLGQSDGLCLTGSGGQIGVAACQAASTQLWTLGTTGTLQLGSFCLGVDAAGSIAQGTVPVFARCAAGNPRQAWVVAGGNLTLGGFNLVPTTQPPPSYGLTGTTLSTGYASWLFGL